MNFKDYRDGTILQRDKLLMMLFPSLDKVYINLRETDTFIPISTTPPAIGSLQLLIDESSTLPINLTHLLTELYKQSEAESKDDTRFSELPFGTLVVNQKSTSHKWTGVTFKNSYFGYCVPTDATHHTGNTHTCTDSTYEDKVVLGKLEDLLHFLSKELNKIKELK